MQIHCDSKPLNILILSPNCPRCAETVILLYVDLVMYGVDWKWNWGFSCLQNVPDGLSLRYVTMKNESFEVK